MVSWHLAWSIRSAKVFCKEGSNLLRHAKHFASDCLEDEILNIQLFFITTQLELVDGVVVILMFLKTVCFFWASKRLPSWHFHQLSHEMGK
jgi:hypothetical protein